MFQTGVNILLQVVLVRTCSLAEVGTFNLALTFSAFLGLILTFGLDRSMVYYIPFFSARQDRGSETGAIRSALAISVGGWAVALPLFLAGIPSLARGVFHKPELIPVLQVLTLGLPCFVLTRLGAAILLGYKKMWPAVWVEQMLVPAIRLAAFATAIRVSGGDLALGGKAYNLGFVLGAIVVIVIIAHGIKWPVNIVGKRIYRDIWGFSGPMLGASLLNNMNNFTEIFMLGWLATSEEVGLFSISYRVASVLLVFFIAITTVLAPYIAELFGRNRLDSFGSLYQVVTYCQLLITLPFWIIVFVEAPTVLAIFAPAYRQGTAVLRVMAMAQLSYLITGPAGQFLIMTRHNRLNLLDIFLTILLSLSLDWYFIPRFGALGAACAAAIALSFFNLLRLIQVFTHFRIHPFGRSFFKVLKPATVTFFTLIGISPMLPQMSELSRMMLVLPVVLSVYSFFFLSLLKKSDLVDEIRQIQNSLEERVA